MFKFDSIVFICFLIISETNNSEKSSLFRFLKTFTLYSAVSRAILKLVYRFGIPNSNPQTLKSVKID